MIRGLYEAHLPVSNLQESIKFYQKFGLELASEQEKLAFFWIVKGESWLGLWESETVNLPYHPSIRHLAFKVDKSEIEKVKEWLESVNIEIRSSFGFSPEMQPLVFKNNPHHAAVYFYDPDGNSLELITPLDMELPDNEKMMTLVDWKKKHMK